MKRTILIAVVSGLLSIGTVFAGDPPTKADVAWRQAVQKMILEGQREFRTPKPERVEILKTLVRELGHTCKVDKNGDSYTVSISKKTAQGNQFSANK
jgi:hypothetical protein